jgi:predicted regulator of Ras-like GTPase activity (Roadblock/LC7/MglB family)
MSGYACKACGASAIVTQDGVVRSCSCNTTVVASMNATVYGKGHASVQLTPVQRLLALFHAAGLDVMKALRGRV